MKHLELIKFILGLTFCSIALLGAIIFFLGYSNGYHYGAGFSNYSLVWQNIALGVGGVSNYTPIFLGICGACGVYLLGNVKTKN